MAAFRFSVALALLATSAHGATLYGEKSQTVRREAPVKTVEMSSRAEMMQVSPAKTDPNTLVTTEEELEDMAVQFCDYDFPTGKTDTNNCTDGSKHEMILQEEMCIFAASEAGATTAHDSFKEPAEWEDKHPKGCFKYKCSESPKNVCYFYNGDGDWPSQPKGTPICSRPKHLNGTKDSAAKDGGCPSGYKVVDDGETCYKSAGCLGYCTGAEFRIGTSNASKHLEYPRGCFIDNTDGCVYYNGPSSMGEGKSVSGTPICNVSKVTTWGEAKPAAKPAAKPEAKPKTK